MERGRALIRRQHHPSAAVFACQVGPRVEPIFARSESTVVMALCACLWVSTWAAGIYGTAVAVRVGLHVRRAPSPESLGCESGSLAFDLVVGVASGARVSGPCAMLWMLWCTIKVLSESLGPTLVCECAGDGTWAVENPEMINLLPYREVMTMPENSL